MRWPLVCAIAAAALSGCGGSSPGGTTDAQVLTGGERLGWDQSAEDTAELATFRYALYVDEARSVPADASCASAPSGPPFSCTCGLPALMPGGHTLQIASFVLDGDQVRESDRSAAVRVIVR